MDNAEEIDRFLDTQELPKLNQKDIKSLTEPITVIEIKDIIKNLQI